MDSIQFIEEVIAKIDTVRNDEFSKNNFTYQEKPIEKKVLNENLMEFRNFQSKIRKKALLDKLKPSNVGKKEYGGNSENIDILEDDIFNNNNNTQQEEIKIIIDELDRESKLKLINEFIQRKNITLDQMNLQKIESIIDNPSISLKQYITISKMYQQITKIGFIKKLEDGLYVVDISEKKVKNKNVFFK
jgi:hypothetical protein